MQRSTLTLPEAAIVSLICFGLFTLGSLQAVLSGFPPAVFTDSGNAWGIGVELVLGGAALLFLRSRGFDIQSLYPRPSMSGTFMGLALFVAGWIVGGLAASLFEVAGVRQMADFSFMGLSLVWIVAFAMVNGAFEEIFLLGVLTRGLRGFGLSVALGVPLFVRALYHLYQGPLGVVWVLGIGLTLAVGYIVTRSLWAPVLAHTLWDIVPIVAG